MSEKVMSLYEIVGLHKEIIKAGSMVEAILKWKEWRKTIKEPESVKCIADEVHKDVFA